MTPHCSPAMLLAHSEELGSSRNCGEVGTVLRDTRGTRLFSTCPHLGVLPPNPRHMAHRASSMTMEERTARQALAERPVLLPPCCWPEAGNARPKGGFRRCPFLPSDRRPRNSVKSQKLWGLRQSPRNYRRPLKPDEPKMQNAPANRRERFGHWCFGSVDVPAKPGSDFKFSDRSGTAARGRRRDAGLPRRTCRRRRPGPSAARGLGPSGCRRRPLRTTWRSPSAGSRHD